MKQVTTIGNSIQRSYSSTNAIMQLWILCRISEMYSVFIFTQHEKGGYKLWQLRMANQLRTTISFRFRQTLSGTLLRCLAISKCSLGSYRKLIKIMEHLCKPILKILNAKRYGHSELFSSFPILDKTKQIFWTYPFWKVL